MRGRIERQAGDDDLRERVAGDVDAGPEAVGAEKDGVADLAHLFRELGAGKARALHEEGAIGFAIRGLERLGDGAHVGVAREKDERAAGDAIGAEADVVGEGFDREPGFLRGRQRDIGGDENAHVAFEIERRFDGDCAGVVGAGAGGERRELAADGEGGAGADDAGVAGEKELAEFGCDVDGCAAEGDDGFFLSDDFEPVNVFGVGEGEEFGNAGAVAGETHHFVAELVANFSFGQTGLDAAELTEEFGEWGIEPGLGEIFVADAEDWARGEKFVVEEREELTGSVDAFLDGEDRGGFAEFREEALAFGGIVDRAKEALEAEAGDGKAEVLGGDLGDGVGFVEDDKVVGAHDAARVLFTDGFAEMDEGEEQAVIDDEDVSGIAALFCALVEAAVAIAVFFGAAGGVGGDGFPDLVGGRRFEFVAEAGVGEFGPLGDAEEFALFGMGEEVLFVVEGGGETRGAEVVGFADQYGGFEVGVAGELGGGFEEPAADREVFGFELFLEGDCVGGDDELAGAVDGVDDAGGEVGEGFADAGAGFEEERGVVAHRSGDGAGHLFLFGAMFERKRAGEDAILGKNVGGHFGRATAHRRRWRGVGVVAKADHGGRNR